MKNEKNLFIEKDAPKTSAKSLTIETLEPRIAPTTIVPTNVMGPGRTAGWGC